jgi:hypothetical protein
MRRKKTKEERYQIAKLLDSIIFTRDLADDEQLDALFDAIEIVSPEYAAEQAAEIEADINSPEAAAFAAEAVKTETAKAFIADIERYKRGEITMVEMREKWGAKPRE